MKENYRNAGSKGRFSKYLGRRLGEIIRAHGLIKLPIRSVPLIIHETQRKNSPNQPPVLQSNLQPSTLSQAFIWNAWFIIKEITFREVLYIMAAIGGPSERKMILTLSPMDQLTFLNCLLSILF